MSLNYDTGLTFPMLIKKRKTIHREDKLDLHKIGHDVTKLRPGLSPAMGAQWDFPWRSHGAENKP